MAPRLEVVSGELPEPPYPEDTWVRGWRFELDHERIDASDTWALAQADMRPWLLMLWLTGWKQRPAGSLPNNDRLIAARIGMEPRVFAANREILMLGWVLHSDGRLYHNVIVQQVCKYLSRREGERARKEAWREAKKKQQDAENVPRGRHGTDADRRGTDMGRTLPEPEPEPEEKKTHMCRPATHDKTSRFDDFWAAWPDVRKRDKKRAAAIWAKRRLDAMADEIIADVQARKAGDAQWQHGYVPMPTTYLNGNRWEDTLTAPITGGPNAKNLESRADRHARTAARLFERAASHDWSAPDEMG